MSKLVVILLIAGFIYLAFFNRPRQHSVDELQRWFDARLTDIAGRLEHDIELDKQGQYRHPGRQAFEPRGEIAYTMLDKNYARFELSEKNALNADHITMTAGYRLLQQRADELGLQLRVEEVRVEGDDVDDNFSLDEYIDDIPRYYRVIVSGW